MVVPMYPGRMVPQVIFMAQKLGMGFFEGGGVKCQSRDFFEFCLKP